MDKNIKLLDYMFDGYECSIVAYYKNFNDVILMFTNITDNTLCRIKFMNVIINADVDDRLAFDLNDAIEYVNSGCIEILGAEYGKRDSGKYFFKAELAQIPKQYFDYSKLSKIKVDFYGEIIEEVECPMVSFIADKIEVEIFEKIVNIDK